VNGKPVFMNVLASNWVNFLLYPVFAVCGFILYLTLASYFQWIMPIWWGGEALVAPIIFGIPTVVVAAALAYALTFGSYRGSVGSSYFWYLLLIAIVQGFLLYPSIELFIKIKEWLPFWRLLHPLVAITLGFTIAGALSIVLVWFLAKLLDLDGSSN